MLIEARDFIFLAYLVIFIWESQDMLVIVEISFLVIGRVLMDFDKM